MRNKIKPWHLREFAPNMLKELGDISDSDKLQDYRFKELIHELHCLNNNLFELETEKQSQTKELRHISSGIALLCDLLQFNIGVRVNSSSIRDIADSLDAINEKLGGD